MQFVPFSPKIQKFSISIMKKRWHGSNIMVESNDFKITTMFLTADSIFKQRKRVRNKTCSETPRPVPSFQPCFFNSCKKAPSHIIITRTRRKRKTKNLSKHTMKEGKETKYLKSNVGRVDCCCGTT